MSERIGLLGGSSLVGSCIISSLKSSARRVTVFSRDSDHSDSGKENRKQLNTIKYSLTEIKKLNTDENIKYWISVAPIWVLPDYFTLFEAYGARRIIVLSSTSLFSKQDSSDTMEQSVVNKLRSGERQLKDWATARGAEWIILRPTLIYGLGKDKNISQIMRFIKRFGFFPLLGKANGLRQPIHADDVAKACIDAMDASAISNHAYNISGGETLTYREMVERIFQALQKPVRILSMPLFLFRFIIWLIHFLSRFRDYSYSMAVRMNQDLVYDHSDAEKDFGFSSRTFQISKNDLL